MIIDISRKITENTYVYPDDPIFKKEIICDNPQVSLFHIGSHTGTHIDSPAHFFKSMETVADINLNKICGKAKVIEIKNKNIIEKSDLTKYNIEKGDIILFKTSNSYNFDGENPLSEYVSLSYECALYLVEKQINVVGIDYISIEAENSINFDVHKILLKNNIYIIETLDLKNIDEGEYKFYCLPLNINSDGCPVRCILEI